MRRNLLLCFCLSAMCLFAEEPVLHVVPLEGNLRDMALSAIGKVVYRGDSLYVRDQIGNVLYAQSLRHIGHIVYAERQKTPTDISTSQEQAEVKVYPNPTQGLLMVQNAEGEQVHIYDLQGKVVLAASLYEGTASVDVSLLPVGTYVLLVQNGVFQFIKQ